MIILVHGENVSASLAEVEKLKSQYRDKKANIIELPGNKLTESIWEESLAASGLFTQEQLVVVTDYFSSKTKKDIDFEKIDTAVVFYETQRISNLPKISGLVSKKFDLDPVVFKFVESIRPGNQKEMLVMFTKYLESEIPEIILTMMVRQFRLMLLSKTESVEGPPEWANIQPWQKSRLSTQAANFSLDKLKEAYQELLIIDVENKNGVSILPLSDRLELLLLNL